MKHTPEPWEVLEFGKLVFIVPTDLQVKEERDRQAICEMLGSDKVANGRLMAASPNLLKFCKAAYIKLLSLGMWDGRLSCEGQGLLSGLRDSIAKATGESEQNVQESCEEIALSKAEGREL